MRRDIQALRGFAVLAVVLFHIGGLGVRGGFLGVDIFFVISGFVITRKLSLSQGSLGHVLSDFYKRRMRRILPSSLLTVVLTIGGSWLFLAPLNFHRFAMDAYAAIAFVPTLFFMHQQTDYLNQGLDASPFLHYWSLGVEEQFYLIWPIVFIALFRKRIQWLRISLAIFTVLSVIWTSQSAVSSFYLPFTRFWEFMAGAVLIYSRIDHIDRPLRTLMNIAGWAGAIFSVIHLSTNDATPGLTTLIPIVSAMLIILSNRTYSLIRPLAWLGDISFSFYLVHWPIILFMAYGLTGLSLSRKVSIFLISLLAAALMYYLYENPIRRSKQIAHHTFRLVFALVSISAISAAGLQYSAATAVSSPQFTIDLSSPIIYANGCHLNFGASNPKPTCIFGDTSAKPSIALIGDSHAAQWFPAFNKLATDRHWKLYTFTKSSCPATYLATMRNGVVDKACEEWQKNVSKLLNKIHPTRIVIANFTNQEYSLVKRGGNYQSAWSVGLRLFVASIKSSSITILGDTPLPVGNSTNISSCLSKNVKMPGNCDFPLMSSITTKSTKGLANSLAINYVDPTPWLCGVNTKKINICGAVFQGHNLLRDATHISVATSLGLTAKLGELYK